MTTNGWNTCVASHAHGMKITGDSWDSRGDSSREEFSGVTSGRRRAGRQVQRGASNPSISSSSRGHSRGRSGSRPSSGRRSAPLSHGQPRSAGRRSVEPLPEILQGKGGPAMRKGELEDALALASLLNLPAGGAGGAGGARRKQSDKPKGGAGARNGRGGRPPQRAVRAADGW